jgi:hypothetical protein
MSYHDTASAPATSRGGHMAAQSSSQLVGGGDPGVPYRWIPGRRDQMRAELEAAMLLLYGLDREDTEHVLDSFPIVRRYEERDHSEFRTKRLVLAAYDAMTSAVATGVAFVSPLDPPPGEGPRHEEKTS